MFQTRKICIPIQYQKKKVQLQRYIYVWPSSTAKALRSCFELKGTANNMSKDSVQESHRHILLTPWVALCLCMLSFAAGAQVDQGAVAGTVVDQEGTVIPNANATLTDLGTALKREISKPAQLCKILP